MRVVRIDETGNSISAVAPARSGHSQGKPQGVARPRMSVGDHRPKVDGEYIPEGEFERMGVHARHGRRSDEAMMDPVDAPIQKGRAMQEDMDGVEGDLGDEGVKWQLYQ